jgi:hypothetical protein
MISKQHGMPTSGYILGAVMCGFSQTILRRQASHLLKELWLSLGDAHHQAALVSVVLVTSTPSLNLIPSMTFGNWFLPLRRNHFFDAA